jgi:hypothetical protein
MKRRDFFKTASVAAVASTLQAKAIAAENDPGTQQLHQDYQSNNPGTEYYMIGNGSIQAAVQTSPSPEAGTHCGLLVMSPDHFGRKISSFLYHPERGLQNSRLFVTVGGVSYLPVNATVSWSYPDGIPTIVISSVAGPCTVREEIACPANEGVITRSVFIQNGGATPVKASALLLLYPNLMLFDEYNVDRKNMTLTATGYDEMQLFAMGASMVGDRHLTVDFGTMMPGAEASTVFVLTLNHSRDALNATVLKTMNRDASAYWHARLQLNSGDDTLDHLVRTSLTGLRTGVAKSGKMDGSIWQYNLEWVRDQSMVAAASSMAGHADIAESLLRRILTRSVDDEGHTVDSSRQRPPETMELDQNGELLYALWTHWMWTGNDAIIREFWPKISSVADYVLSPIFRDPAIGLVRNTREYWEREAFFGVREGYELAYQHWNIVGLNHAADLAALMKEGGMGKRWKDAAGLMKTSFLSHPKFSLVQDGRFIKRRLLDGEVQRVFNPPDRNRMPEGMPLRVEPVCYCDPDASMALPIAFELVDPSGPIAGKTLEALEHLWNQRWDGGGYARYDITSEPDSPGPWPFATLFITRAYLEAGNHEKVWRALHWLRRVQGGNAGAWLEFYGDRPTPPLPPVGIVVWTWAEVLFFAIHHVLGVRPNAKDIMLRPRLLTGLGTVEARVPVRNCMLHLTLKATADRPYARVDGASVPLHRGAISIPHRSGDVSVEIALPVPYHS